MSDKSTVIRDIARKLLDEKQVELVIGFEKGTQPLRATPCFVRRSEDAERLVWDSSCENNLARYLPRRSGKIGIVAKGCDARAIVSLIKEKQIARDQLYIIGVPCDGVVDRRKVAARMDGKDFLEAGEAGDAITLRGHGFTETVAKSEALHDSCLACAHRNPPIYDVLVGDKVPENAAADPYREVADFEARPADERWQSFTDEVSRCIRCYACRNACPMCYCRECFADCTQPQWLGKTTSLSDNAIFHIVRAFHMTGRCVDCGACDRACPVGVDVRKLTKKIEKDVKDLFEYEAGVSLDDMPPLATFNPDDPQEFIK